MPIERKKDTLNEKTRKDLLEWSKELEDILNKDPYGESIKKIIDMHIISGINTRTYSEIGDAISLRYSRNIANLLFGGLIYPNPKVLIDLFEKAGLSDGVRNFMKDLYSIYWSALKKSLQSAINPKQWVRITSNVYVSDQEYFSNRIILEDDSVVEFDSSLQSTFDLINHFLNRFIAIKLKGDPESFNAQIKIVEDNLELLKKTFKPEEPK